MSTPKLTAVRGLSRLWLIALFLVGAGALVAAALGAYHSTQRLLAAGELTAAAHTRAEQLSVVRDALIDAETGSRGFVITGDSAFLTPYNRANAVIDRELDTLAALYQLHPERLALVASLRTQVALRRSHADSTVALRRAGDFAGAQALVASGRGRILTDSIRALVAAILADEQEAEARGRLAVAAATRSTTRTIAVEGGLAVGLLLLTFVALWRETRRREAATLEVEALNASLAGQVAQVRRDLQSSEQRLSNALDGLLEGCALIGFDFRYLYVNRASSQQGRSTVEQMVGRTMMEVYPGFEATALHEHIRATLVDRVTHEADLPFTFPDGSTGWFRLHFEPVTEGAFVLSIEITERMKALGALEASEARHRALLEGLPDLVCLVDQSGTVIDLHAPPGIRLVTPPTELVGQPLTTGLSAELAAEFDGAVQQSLESRLPQTVAYALEFPEGLHHFEATFVPTGGSHLTVVVRDITGRMNLEHQLRQSQKMEAVGQLTGGIAHDFNNVLTIIGSNAEMLAMEAPEGAPPPAELAEILRATRRGALMIERLLKFSRRGPLARQAVDPAEVVREMLDMLERLIPASIQLDTGVLEPGSTVLLDPGALEQVLANLCTNAKDAMPEGGTIRIDVQATDLDAGYHATHPWVRPGRFVCIALRDTGIGMDAETRARIFEPFFTTKPAGVGTGLGLSMVYGIMKEHEGMVHVYSEPGQGTVVKLYFPVSFDEPLPATPVDMATAARLAAGRGELLLLAEDDDAIRLATRRALEKKGYRVVDAADGEQALAAFRRHRQEVRLVISDLIMPNLGGHQLAEALRAGGEEVPILFTSGYSRDSVYREPVLPTGTSFLHKPWTLAELLHTVRRLIDEAGAEPWPAKGRE